MQLTKNDLWEGGSSPKVVAYVLRHGSTELNDQGKFRGPLDPPLDQHGLEDAHAAGDYFSGIELGHAFSSDRDRTETTARAVLQPKGMNYTPDPNLRAWNVGYLAGQDKASHQDDISYFQRHPDEQIPNGESLNQFRDRVRPSILKAIQLGISTGKPSLIAGHSSIVKETSNIIHGDHDKVSVKPGGIAAVTYDGSNFDFKALTKAKTGKGMGNGYGQ